MTAEEVRVRSTPERNERLRIKWHALKAATLALRGLEEQSSAWQEAYSHYVRASRDYASALAE